MVIFQYGGYRHAMTVKIKKKEKKKRHQEYSVFEIAGKGIDKTRIMPNEGAVISLMVLLEKCMEIILL